MRTMMLARLLRERGRGWAGAAAGSSRASPFSAVPMEARAPRFARLPCKDTGAITGTVDVVPP